MSRQFSIPTVFRMVPNALLREFLERLGHVDKTVGWPQLRERDIEPLMRLFGGLTNQQQDLVEAALRDVFELACESGLDALVEGATLCGEDQFLHRMPDEYADYGRAMWAWLNQPTTFKKAVTLHQVDHLSWWRKRNDLPPVAPDLSESAKATLAAKISDVLIRAQGRGKMCTVETLARGEKVYVFAFPDDFVQNVTTHDEDGQLSPRIFRKTFEIVFAFNITNGTLELFAKVPAKYKRILEESFAQTMLGSGLGEWEPDVTFELNHLRETSFVLHTDPVDRLQARISDIRLAPFNQSRRIDVHVDPDDVDECIVKAIRECLNPVDTPLSQCNILSVTFCFDFLPCEDRKPGRLRVTIGFPNTCGIRCDRPERIELVHKYLKLWKIDVGRPIEADFAAVGT